MRIQLWIFSLVLALAAKGAEIHFNFSDTAVGALPTNFVPLLAGTGAPGDWRMVMDDVPSQFGALPGEKVMMTRHAVLAQTSTDPTDERFPMLLYTGEKFRDFKFLTRFKLVGGKAEQMAGFVFRYQNSSNYYVIRASGLGTNIAFYKVVGGNIVPGGYTLQHEFPAGVWHTLEVECRGVEIECRVDGQKAMPTITENSSPADGLIGFRTKSDSVAYFDAASVTYKPILPGAQALVDRIVAEKTKLLGLRIYTPGTNGTTSVIASKDKSELGLSGTDAEANAILDGTVWYGKEKGAVVVTMPLHDRNGESIAAVRVQMKSFLGETQDTAVTRARMVVKEMQTQIGSAKDLE